MNNNVDIKDFETQKGVVSKLIESSSLNRDFYLLMVLSSAITCFGLLLNNIVIVIGGMMVTPFLSPVLMLALSVVISDGSVLKRSFTVIVKSIFIILAVSIVGVILVPGSDVDLSLISKITGVNLSYFFVSLAAGAAAAYTWARPNLSTVLPGVAISVTLLPPLASIGITLAFFEAELLVGAVRSAAVNILGLLLASTFVFALLGFYRVRYYAKKEVKKEQEEKEKKEASAYEA